MSKRGDNIRKRKDGRWEGRYIFSRDSQGKAIYHSVYGRSFNEVKEKLNNVSQNTKSIEQDNNCSTVDVMAENWLQKIKLCKKYSTYIKYSYIYNSHIKQHLGNKPINSINVGDCISLIEFECFKENNDGKKLSKSMINSIRNVLLQIMNYGDNPIEISEIGCKVQVSQNFYPREISIFTKEEQKKLHNYLLNDMNNFKLGIYVCMLTGLRLGEICALRTDNIDLSERTISVTQTAQRLKSEKVAAGTELIISRPKTVNSNRIIPICDILLSVLRKHLSCNLYLVNGNNVMEPRTYQYFFQRILASLSIEKKNFHSLRHTFATNCIDSGMDPKCLSEILGHSDVKTTLNRYVHPSLEQKMKQINFFATDYGQINGSF